MLKLFFILSSFTVIDGRPQISLAYQPARPFYHPRPAGSHLGQIIPSGKPWPQSVGEYQGFSQTSTPLPNRFNEGETTNQLGFQWPSSTEKTTQQQQSSTSNPNRIQNVQPTSTTTTTTVPQKQTPIVLGYKPTRPFYHPNPGSTLGQIIPPSKPLPDSSNSNLENRIKETTLKPVQTTTRKNQNDEKPTPEQPPSRPSFHPNPGNNVGQIIPPGKPWPSNQEDYQNFTQIQSPNLNNRDKEKPGNQTNLADEATTPSTTTSIVTSGSINLEYKPSRPPFHPNPGNQISQIVPPGQAWPSKPEDYQNFGQVTAGIEDRFQTPTTSKPETSPPSGFIWEEDTDPSKFTLGQKVESTTMSLGHLFTSSIYKEDKVKSSTEVPIINKSNFQVQLNPDEIPADLVEKEDAYTYLIIPLYNVPPFLYFI